MPARKTLAYAATAALLAAPATGSAEGVADTIYTGGPIVTIDDDAPTADAVAVRDGTILAVGPLAEVMAHQGDGTVLFDLDGRAMLPGFFDSHGHVLFGGLQAMSANLLSPPDGEVTDIASLQKTLSDWMADNPDTLEKVNLVIGFGYDNARLAELRHPTADDLDAVSTDIPIIIIHQSGHLGALNSAGLAAAGITAATENPPGGVIRRKDDGSPNGVVEEYAFFNAFMPLLADLGAEGQLAFAKAGAEMWARFGYTTGQDGRSSGASVDALRQVGAAGDLPIDVVAFPDVLADPQSIEGHVTRNYENGVRVGGCKVTIDGSPQGFTALRDRPYYDPVGTYPPGYLGYSAITAEQLQDAVNWCFERDYQILTHANGEGAMDMLIGAIGAARDAYGDKDTRPVIVHGQFMREDQVDSFQRLDVFPSVFPMHTYYWGDWHRDHTVGPERADNISPTGWIRTRGMIFGSHHDAPVALPNSMRVLAATVTRRTRSGDILGPAQRVDVLTALKAMTLWPAWQHHEEDRKGSIEVGKQADFVILSDDPTAVDPETLADLQVRVTIKADKVVYEADDATKEGHLDTGPVLRSPAAAHNLLHILYSGMNPT
ncbi:amidohydrolase [Oceanomicrobium pacificus]|uniref:Amidohydrolase family protein n=1 Tax=Oceanomicrobium pacificus TaxID=2692916 RepID=A0A6B0TMG9_9RHOB|nr:amidohydrolase [Oceanomicrobium pacificus]MXU65086.1 amidohydrolase family protein [Oceanomicrobium pacificus]